MTNTHQLNELLERENRRIEAVKNGQANLSQETRLLRSKIGKLAAVNMNAKYPDRSASAKKAWATRRQRKRQTINSS